MVENFLRSDGAATASVVPLPGKGSRSNTGCHGPIDLDVDHGERVGSRWSLTNDDSAPYCADADAQMPVGTIIPGVITTNTDPPKSDRLRCKAQWAAGRWTLIAARPLTTTTDHVAIADRTFIWVAVFDHTTDRHTRHIRPIRLEVKSLLSG